MIVFRKQMGLVFLLPLGLAMGTAPQASAQPGATTGFTRPGTQPGGTSGNSSFRMMSTTPANQPQRNPSQRSSYNYYNFAQPGFNTAYSPYGANAGYPNAYYPYVDPYAGYLSGSAMVIDSAANYMVSQQQAYLMQEQQRQAKVDTRKRTYDQWLYERANTPTIQDERERNMREALRRSINDPPVTEIWSAQALNTLLADLQKLQSANMQGSPVPLSAEVLRQINVTTGRSGGASIGVIKDGGRLDWPQGLRVLPPRSETEALRKQMESQVRLAMTQAGSGTRVDADLVQQMNDEVERFRKLLKGNVGNMSVSQYSECKRYLTDVEDALKVLGSSDASKYVGGQYAPQGHTVQELVQYMSREGLQFSAATAGEEGAYVALHKAMVQADISAKSQYRSP